MPNLNFDASLLLHADVVFLEDLTNLILILPNRNVGIEVGQVQGDFVINGFVFSDFLNDGIKSAVENEIGTDLLTFGVNGFFIHHA